MEEHKTIPKPVNPVNIISQEIVITLIGIVI